MDDVLNIKNFKLFRGGGVAIFIKFHLNCVRINDLPINNTKQLWLFVKINNKLCAIGSVYRPPSCSILDFIDNFGVYLRQLVKKFDGIICGGDFNIDYLDVTSSSYASLSNVIVSI